MKTIYGLPQAAPKNSHSLPSDVLEANSPHAVHNSGLPLTESVNGCRISLCRVQACVASVCTCVPVKYMHTVHT